MGRRCVAYGCSHSVDTGRKLGLTFHRFPDKVKDKKRFREWRNNIRWQNWEPTKDHVLCSTHFHSDCFDGSSQKPRLLPSAVPTNFSFPPHLCKKPAGRHRSAVRRQALPSGGGAAGGVPSQGSARRPLLTQLSLPRILLDHDYAGARPANDGTTSAVPSNAQQGQKSAVQQSVQHGSSSTWDTAVNAVLEHSSKTVERVDSPVTAPSLRVKVPRNIRYCYAPNCKNNGKSRPDLAMFKLPEDPKRFDKWFTNCGWKFASTSWFLCSEHFEEDQFVDKDKRDTLVWDAAPTIFVVTDHQLSLARLQAAQGDSNSLCPSMTTESIGNTSSSEVEARRPEEMEGDVSSASETALYDAYGTPFILVGKEPDGMPHTSPKPLAGEPLTPKEEPPDPDLPPMPETHPLFPVVEEISIAKEEVPELSESECPVPDMQPLLLPSQLALGTAGLMDGVPETLGHASSANVSPAVSGMEKAGAGVCNGDVPLFDFYGTPFVLIGAEPPGADPTHPLTPTQQKEADVPRCEPSEMLAVKEDPLDQERPGEMLVTSGLLYAQDTKEEEEGKPQGKRSSNSSCPNTQSKRRRRCPGTDVTPAAPHTVTPTSDVTHTTPTPTTAAVAPPHLGSGSGGPCVPLPLPPQTSGQTNTGREDDQYVLVKRSKLDAMMERMRCKTCRRDVSLFVEDDGLDVTLLVGCLCQGSPSTQECEFEPDAVLGDSSRQFTEANMLAVYHVLVSGDGYCGLQGIAGSIGRPCLSRETFQAYSAHLYDMMEQHFSTSMKEARQAIQKHYRLFLGQTPGKGGMDIAVMFGWTGLIAGLNTQLGIGVVMEADTGVVLDFEVLSLCSLCTVNRMKLLPTAFRLWRATHHCHGNFNGLERTMESVAAKRLWQRSQRHGFWYTTYVGNSTSVAHLAVRGLKTGVGPYNGCVEVVSSIKHISEYLSARLQTLVQNSEHGRKNGLTEQLVNRLTATFTDTVKKNANFGVEIAQQEVSRVLLHHLHSTRQNTELKHYTNTPQGKNDTTKPKLLQKDVEKVKAVLNDFTSADVMRRCISGDINHFFPKFWLRMSREERIDVPHMFFRTRVAILENNFGKGAAGFLATPGLQQGYATNSTEEGVKGMQKVS